MGVYCLCCVSLAESIRAGVTAPCRASWDSAAWLVLEEFSVGKSITEGVFWFVTDYGGSNQEKDLTLSHLGSNPKAKSK